MRHGRRCGDLGMDSPGLSDAGDVARYGEETERMK